MPAQVGLSAGPVEPRKGRLCTVKEPMSGTGIERPANVAATDEALKKALKAKASEHEQNRLSL